MSATRKQYHGPLASSKITSRVRMSFATLDVVDFGVPSIDDCSLRRTTANAAKMSARSSEAKEGGRRKRWNEDKTNPRTRATNSAEELAGHYACSQPIFSKIVSRTQNYSFSGDDTTPSED
eukprot:814534-Rhodomonas_salina.1